MSNSLSRPLELSQCHIGSVRQVTSRLRYVGGGFGGGLRSVNVNEFAQGGQYITHTDSHAHIRMAQQKQYLQAG